MRDPDAWFITLMVAGFDVSAEVNDTRAGNYARKQRKPSAVLYPKS
jgi:hypothetical protein